MKHGTIITIGRQCGSGGHEIGRKLAEKLGVACYDKELLRLAAERSGMAPENFELYDEAPSNSLLYALSLGHYDVVMGAYDLPLYQKIFMAQFETIQALADRGEGCVIIGRCADYALAKRDRVINVFLWATPAARVKRLMEQYPELTEKKAADQMVKTDKRRAGYHNFYADTRWGDRESYDLMLNSLQLGVDKTVELLAEYAHLRFPDDES